MAKWGPMDEDRYFLDVVDGICYLVEETSRGSWIEWRDDAYATGIPSYAKAQSSVDSLTFNEPRKRLPG